MHIGTEQDSPDGQVFDTHDCVDGPDGQVLDTHNCAG
jgi:hypothetical protein